jgi:hypothetical protein
VTIAHIASVILVLSAAPAAFAQDAAPTAQQELDALRAEIAGLKARQSDEWLDAQRAEQVRATVADVLADSGARTSFQATSGAAGYDRGFFVRDGAFTLRVNALEQVRFVWNNGYAGTASVPGSGAADNQWGFENRRTQAFLSGTAVDPSWTYLVGFAYDSQFDPYVPAADELRLLYANVSKSFGNGLSLVVGQMNVPWTVESQLFNAGYAQMGDYSPFEYTFGVGQATGAMLQRETDAFRAKIGLYNVFASVQQSSWDSDENQSVALAARGEWKIAGTWDQFARESSARGNQFGLVAGVGVLWENGRAINLSTGVYGANVEALTVDLRADFGGANLVGQFFIGETFGDDSYGAALQGGAYLADTVEAFGSFTYVGAGEPSYLLQAGANWYLSGDGLKATGYVIVPINQSFSPLVEGLGLGSFANNVSLVVQLQLMF